MSPAPDAVTPKKGEICIDASQLRPGVHVRLPVPWVEHQFMFNSFVIADAEQARLIAAMKLPQLFCDPTRCKVAAAAATGPQQAPGRRRAAAEAVAEKSAGWPPWPRARMAEKHARARVMSELRGRLDKAQQHYLGAAAKSAAPSRASRLHPREAIEQVARVSEESTTTALLADPDSAIVLIAEKAHDDGHAAHSLSVMTLALLLGKQAGYPNRRCARSASAPCCTTSASWRSSPRSCATANATGTRKRSTRRIAAPATTQAARRQACRADARRHPAPSRALRRQRLSRTA
jgi:hypothetical protein